jgi:hypothetical protein
MVTAKEGWEPLTYSENTMFDYQGPDHIQTTGNDQAAKKDLMQ